MWVEWGLEPLIQTKKGVREKMIPQTFGTRILKLTGRGKSQLFVWDVRSRIPKVGVETRMKPS
jgi:hypothetical protein